MTCITCTRGNRPALFSLLETYMARQTVKDWHWVVVNSGEPYSYNMGQTVIQREPSQDCDLVQNLGAALPYCQGPVVFIEDDDWYGPTYLKVMAERMKEYDMVGNLPVLYYNLPNRRYYIGPYTEICNLGGTGINEKVLPFFADQLKRLDPYIDYLLWRYYPGPKRLFVNDKPLMVGIKDGSGIGKGHHPNMGTKDNQNMLAAWIGDDARYYSGLLG